MTDTKAILHAIENGEFEDEPDEIMTDLCHEVDRLTEQIAIAMVSLRYTIDNASDAFECAAKAHEAIKLIEKLTPSKENKVWIQKERKW